MRISAINFYSNNNVQNNKSKVQQYNSAPAQLTQPTNNINKMFAYSYLPNISFTGALNWEEIAKYSTEMGKRIYSKRNVTDLSGVYENASGITLGRGLPKQWTSRIVDLEHFDKDSFITEFGEIFAEERKFADVDNLMEKLSQLFQKHKIIDKDTPFSVDYIDHGFQAWTYRIGIGTDKDNGIVTKLFKRTHNYLQNHGNHTEQNLAEYVKNYAGDSSEFVKYYYGDTKHGIMVVDYLPANGKHPENILDLRDIGIRYGDEKAVNRRSGFIIDFGGIETDTNLVGNQTAIDIHKAIKGLKNDEDKVEVFNHILEQKADTDEFKDKVIGLVHAVKYLPKEMQSDMYKRCHEIGSNRVNIALVQNIKNFDRWETEDLVKALTTNVTDEKTQETIAKEIKNIPADIAHRFFEEYSNTEVSAIIKYLARNINCYYKDLENRGNIYNDFVNHCDTYSGVALINAMGNIRKATYDSYFEKFFAKNDPILNTTLARNLELFNQFDSDSETIKLQRKWIEKLLETDNVNVQTGLAETIPYIHESLRASLFERLLPTKDRVAKEFLAQNITSIPGYGRHPEWVSQLLENADNMVRGSLANTIKGIKDDRVKKEFSQIVLNGADNWIARMLQE